jgi:hypothetical protein
MVDYSARPVTVSAWVSADPEKVMTLLSDTRNDPLWCPNVDSVSLVEGEPIAPGSRFTFRQHLDRRGKRTEFDAEVEVIELTESSIRWTVSDRFSVRDIAMTVRPDGVGTRVSQTTKTTFLKDPGVTRWVYPFFAKRVFKDQFKHLTAYFAESDSE